MTSREALALLSDRMPEIRQRFGVRDLAIFGSVARDEAAPGSDLDVLVEFADRPNFDNYMGLKLYLKDVFGTSVDLVIHSDLRPAPRPRIEQEALRMSREWLSYVDDILESCRRVRSYTSGIDQAALLNNTMAYDAVLRNPEIIGEAAKRIPDDVRQQMPHIEWTKIVGMRNWLAHAYFAVNPHIVWDVVTNKLPELEQAVEAYKTSDQS